MVSENVTADVMYNLSYHVIHNASDDSQTMYPEDLSQQPYPYPLEFKPVWEVAVKTLLYVPVIVFAIIGNVVVILVVVKNKRMQVSDVCVGVL